MDSKEGIDPRAVIDPRAKLGSGVCVGPFCVIGPGVKLGDGCRIEPHTVIQGDTELGPDNTVGPAASLGGPPQDLKYGGEPTRLVIGSGNSIREYVTFNRGTKDGGGVTRIGDGNLFMAYAHVGHDCIVGNRAIFANAATLAGHVEVGDEANVGGYSGVHQFCRVAKYAFIGGYSAVNKDALPWVLTVGNRAKSYGLNMVGLRRRGYDKETIGAIKRCYTLLFQSKLTQDEALAKAESEVGQVEEARYFIEFVRTSKRGVCR
jgi:UDP-N-acetylglucosamine acyltransferase